LALLTAASVIGAIDRSAMVVVAEPVKHEFHLPDAQLGLLTGLSFGAAYAASAIPLGVLVDRVNRRTLLAILMAMWSLTTAAGALASTFAALLIMRMAVGATESGASPSAHSIVADVFPPPQRATAISILSLGSPLGGFICFLVGSRVASAFGWRAAFLLAASPGLIIAGALMVFIREPPRDVGRSTAPIGDLGLLSQLRTLASGRLRMLLLTVITLSTLAVASFGVWFTSILVREHGFSLRDAGTALAIGSGVFGCVGAALSGRLADAIAHGRPSVLLAYSATTLSITLIAALLAALSPWTPLALVGLALYGLTSPAYIGPCMALLLNITPNRSRGVVVGAVLVTSNFVGAGLGPWATGLISDHLSGRHALSHAVALILTAQAAAILLLLGEGVRTRRAG
jgi:predicted MFS family arabinose efflux permease